MADNRRTASGTFVIDSWDAQPYDEQDGATLTRTRVTKTFHGEVEGHSTAELLMAAAGEGSAAYAGFERVSARVHGRSGTFVLHHNATMAAGERSATWSVLPGSGTGELRGLRGEARIGGDPAGTHTFELEYEVPLPATPGEVS
jgi:hypothetical protein